MKRILKWLALVLIALLLIMLVLWWWLSSTRSGAEWALAQVHNRVEQLNWNTLSGSLSDGLVLENVQFRQAGMEAEMDRLELAVGVRPGRPLRVTIKRLHIDGLDIALPEAQAQEANEPFALGDYSLPITLNLQKVRMRNVVIQPPPAEQADAQTVEPIEIQRLELAGLVHHEIRLDLLELELAPFQLEAKGRQGLSEPWRSELDLGFDWQVDADTLQQLQLSTDGDLQTLMINISAAGPAVAEASLSMYNIDDVDALSAELELAGALQHWPELALVLEQVELSASGGRNDWQAALNTDAIWADYPPIALDLQASGRDQYIQLERGLIDLFDGTVALSGQADLTDAIQANARIELNELDFTPLYPNWPKQARLAGAMDIQLDQHQIEVENLNLLAPPSALNVSGQAQMNLETQALSTALSWQSLSWPPVLESNEAEPLFSSESGTFEASGTLDEWRAELEAIMALPGVLNEPDATLNLDASGDAEQVSQFNARFQSSQAGTLSVSGRAGFNGRLNAELNLQQFNPAVLAEQLPGQINGRLRLSIENPQALSATLDIDELNGRLRNLPMVGSGGLSLQQQVLRQADLKLSLGDNVLDLQSSDGQIWQLQAQAPDLNQLWPELTGELFLSGSATPEQGRAEWQLSSDEISWREFRARAVHLQAQIESLPTPLDAAPDLSLMRPSVELRLTANDVDLNPWERLETFSLSVSGNCRQHTLTTELSGSRADFAVAVEGALPECLDNMRHWQGSLNQFDLTETAWGNWRLADAVSIVLVENEWDIGATCLQADQSNGALCLNEVRAGRSGTAAVRLQTLPLDLVLLPANPPFRVSSRLDGDLRLSWAADGLRSIDGELIVGPGALRTVYGEGDLLTIEQIGLVLDSGSDTARSTAMQARLNARLEGQTTLMAQAEIPDLSDLQTMQLDADLELDLPDVSAFNRLIPQLDELGGTLQGKLSVRGPLADPELNGQLSLRDGRLLHAPLGSRIEQIRLDLTADQTRADLSGQFVAGEGQASVQGEFNARPSNGAGWQGKLSLNGEDLQLFKVDWLSMKLSPELHIGVSEDELNLDGRLAIDRARLGLPPGTEQQIQPSPDIVVVNGDPSEQEPAVDSAALRTISGQIQLLLGEDVRLQAAGMETELVGALDIVWQPETALPTARGTIQLVDGAYSAYGQNLAVETGEVQFTGQPIDNPQLEIEAVREIFGDTQVEKAGVRIRGAARNPDIVLFTSPPTSREKALAYVLTGADFDHAGGQGAFNVGFWVLPSVFVSYGLGLFDSGNVLAARWELSRRWGLRATSGERDTGADISFMIDR
ncbi:MAG: translocation/assembly module TamB domain-containing protein [Pseudomonadota bacterium]